jgi:hypothetical protein
MSLLCCLSFFRSEMSSIDRFELGRQRRVELHAAAVRRVREGQPARVQEGTFEPHHRPQVVPTRRCTPP